eukprot:3583889-Pyramimonas_sp.AAC.1
MAFTSPEGEPLDCHVTRPASASSHSIPPPVSYAPHAIPFPAGCATQLSPKRRPRPAVNSPGVRARHGHC